MADWRQIQARIRKAKTAADAPVKLAQLYDRTRDAMVAFELAQLQEKSGDHAEAAKWYTTAAERFRRAQWRTKAEEALARLGAPVPPAAPAGAPQTTATDITPAEDEISSTLDISLSAEAEAPSEPVGEESTELLSAAASSRVASAPTAAPTVEQAGKKGRRRGRRGGRGRRRGGRREAEAPATQTAPTPAPPEPEEALPTPSFFSELPRIVAVRPEPESAPEPVRRPGPAVTPSWHGRSSRSGEPALASRIAQLESQLRRLLACPMSSLQEAEQAPAGPGVLLLSDSDQVTHYYVEACQTLRIGVGNLLRGGRGSREGGRLKELMAENLGIGESHVTKYMKDHCAVRWIQLDEGAAALSHFAIAVLKPVANE